MKKKKVKQYDRKEQSDTMRKIEQEEKDKVREKIDKQETGLLPKTINQDFDIELNSNEPNRELFTGKNIRFKTELTEEQRGAISILYHAYEQCIDLGINFSGLKQVLDQYIDFGVSMGRKSRDEFVKAQQANAMEKLANGLMQKQNPMENMKM